MFIDEQGLAAQEATIGQGGLLPARDLQNTFSFLRANDLVWNYVQNNYLKGQKPQAFDLLYWNSDSTNLPGPFACWYMRNMYLENKLRLPGKLSMCGEKVDLGKLGMPVYIHGDAQDHIVPWQSAYQSTRILGGRTRFVLGASGHIAGVINPASRNSGLQLLDQRRRQDRRRRLAGRRDRAQGQLVDRLVGTAATALRRTARRAQDRQYQIQSHRAGSGPLRQGTCGLIQQQPEEKTMLRVALITGGMGGLGEAICIKARRRSATRW